MILKLLLVVSVIAIVYFIFFKKSPKSDSFNNKSDINDMVACHRCGLYVEMHESLLSNGKYYCSKECMEHLS